VMFGLGTEDNPVFAGMHEASALVAGATLAAGRAVWSGSAQHGVSITGGMHHAMAGHASGFSIYNDLAIAIVWMLGAGRVRTLPPLDKVGRRIIGEGELMDGPFGPRRVTYARCTAPGRSLDFIEDFIRGAVLPCGGRRVVADDLHLACGLG